MKVFEEAANTLNEEVEVFEFHQSGARGPTGQGLPVGGTANQIIKKSSAVDYATEWFTLTMAFFGLENVTDGAKGSSLSAHGAITTSEDFSAIITDHSASLTASLSITLSNFTAFTNRMVTRFTVSGGGTPTITLPVGWAVNSDSPQTLSTLADGVYDALFKSNDTGSTGTVDVKQIS